MVGNLKISSTTLFFQQTAHLWFHTFFIWFSEVNFANRFYTNKESAKAVAKLMDEEEAKEAAEEAEKAAGSVGYHILGHRFLTWKRP